MKQEPVLFHSEWFQYCQISPDPARTDPSPRESDIKRTARWRQCLPMAKCKHCRPSTAYDGSIIRVSLLRFGFHQNGNRLNVDGISRRLCRRVFTNQCV